MILLADRGGACLPSLHVGEGGRRGEGVDHEMHDIHENLEGQYHA